MNTYRKFSDFLNNHESSGTRLSTLPKAPKTIQPHIAAERTLDGLAALGGILRGNQDSPSASVGGKADQTAITGKKTLLDHESDRGAADRLKHLNQLNSTQSRSEVEGEPAASIQYEAGIPRDWVEGFVRLDPGCAPTDVPPKCWRTFVDDIGRFLEGGWAKKAAALGWGPYELFGADRDRPFIRLDKQGLCWLIKGGRLVGLSSDAAVIEISSGARHTYRRKPIEAGALAWELANTMPQLALGRGPESQDCQGMVARKIVLLSDLPDDFGKNRNP
jgi:hypothetical protein